MNATQAAVSKGERMTKYQQLYIEGTSEAQLESIRSTLSSKKGLTWEEYYWGTKCLIDYDEKETDPELIINSLKKAFRAGLNIRREKDIYQDALKTISSFYSVFRNYDQVINHLMIYIDSLGDEAPDWAYHDMINAQIHTNQIEILIENPDDFLKDLARNDSGSETVEQKQKNLFRDFLFAAGAKVQENRKLRVKESVFAQQAEKYGLLNSDAWAWFIEAVTGKKPKEKGTQRNSKQEGTSGPARDIPAGDNVVVLIPDEEFEENRDVKSREAEVLEQLADTESKLNKSQQLLAEQKEEIGELSRINRKLQAALDNAIAKQQESERNLAATLKRMAEDDFGSESLKREISRQLTVILDLQQERDRLRQAAKTTEEKSKISSRKVNGLERKLYESEEIIKRLQQDNVALRSKIDELEKSSVQNKACEKEASFSDKEIYGRCYYYLNHVCLDAGKEWLRKKLPEISKKYMEDCVFSQLTSSQIITANEKGWTTIYDFDLASVLRIIKGNIRRIPSFIPSSQDVSLVSDMIKIRNSYAHTNGSDINSADVSDDILTMSDFVCLMDGDEDTANEMKIFAESIPA